MSPQVAAAIIAVCGVILTVIATVLVQVSGRRATSRDTQEALKEQRKQLDRTLAEQRGRTLNERFATAAEQLGGEPPAVQLAGVYAMAGLADDWPENRQTCIDVLCGYLRLPYEPGPGAGATAKKRLVFQGGREVRHTVIRVITAHLKKDAAVPWKGLNFDFTSVVFDGGDFDHAEFSGGTVSFRGAEFPSGRVEFQAEFSGAEVDFAGARFSGGTVDFAAARFSGGTVLFRGAEFSAGTVRFGWVEFSGGWIGFGAKFSGGEVDFDSTRFTGGTVDFAGAEFSGGRVRFHGAIYWPVRPRFPWEGAPPQGVEVPGRKMTPRIYGH